MALFSALQKFITKDGQPVEGASVIVKLAGSATPATLYATRDGGAKSNPFLTDAAGNALCYVSPGRYDMTVTFNAEQVTFNDIEVGPVSSIGSFAAGGVVTDPDQLVEDAAGNKWRWSGSLNYTFAPGEDPELVAGWFKWVDAPGFPDALAAPDSTVLVGGVEAGFLGGAHIEEIHVSDFEGPGISDAQAVQAAINAAYALSDVAQPVYVGTSMIRRIGAVVLQPKQYNFGSTPITPAFFTIIKGNRAVLSCNAGGKIFTGTSVYRFLCSEVTFHGDDVQAAEFVVENLDNAKYVFEKCWFSTHTRSQGKFAVDITSQSAVVGFDDCDGIAAPNFLRSTSDFTWINKGWYNGWSVLSDIPSTKNANTAWMECRGRKLWMTDVALIPEADTSGVRSNVRWVDNYGTQLSFRNVSFGGENSGFPIVYQFANSVSGGVGNNTDIAFDSCQAAAGANHVGGGGLITLMPGILPGRYSFKNLTFVSSPLVSPMGWDFNASLEANRTAVINALYSADNGVKNNDIDILVLGVHPFRFIEPWLTPFMRQSELHKTGQYRNSPKDVAIPCIELLSGGPGIGGQSASAVLDISFVIAGDNGGIGAIFWQEKSYRVKVAKSAGVSPSISIEQKSVDIDFPPGAATGGPAAADDVLTASIISSTATKVVVGFTLLSTRNLGGNYSVAWQVKQYTQSDAGQGVGALLVLNYG